MTDVSRALEQIAEIHEHLAKTEVYPWLAIAAGGLVGSVVGLRPRRGNRRRPGRSTRGASRSTGWRSGSSRCVIGCSEIVWHYATRATPGERRRSRQVVGQFLPALVAGALVTPAVIQLSPSLVTLLPGLWALLFGVAVFAARPFVPRASGWVALYYFAAGLFLLWRAPGVDGPLTVGGRRDVWHWPVVCRGGALLEHRAAGSHTHAGAR